MYAYSGRDGRVNAGSDAKGWVRMNLLTDVMVWVVVASLVVAVVCASLVAGLLFSVYRSLRAELHANRASAGRQVHHVRTRSQTVSGW